MTTKDRVLQVLRSTPAHRIRFAFPRSGGSAFTISFSSFNTVAKAIEGGTVKVKVVTTFPAGVAAEYHPDLNEIWTGRIVGRTEEGLVLHECVHCLFDLGSTSVSALDDEAAAYVVDALYFRMTGLSRSRWNAEPHASAGKVADAILHHYQIGDTPTPTVDATTWANLRTTIAGHSVYQSGPAGTGGSYLHNG